MKMRLILSLIILMFAAVVAPTALAEKPAIEQYWGDSFENAYFINRPSHGEMKLTASSDTAMLLSYLPSIEIDYSYNINNTVELEGNTQANLEYSYVAQSMSAKFRLYHGRYYDLSLKGSFNDTDNSSDFKLFSTYKFSPYFSLNNNLVFYVDGYGYSDKEENIYTEHALQLNLGKNHSIRAIAVLDLISDEKTQVYKFLYKGSVIPERITYLGEVQQCFSYWDGTIITNMLEVKLLSSLAINGNVVFILASNVYEPVQSYGVNVKQEFGPVAVKGGYQLVSEIIEHKKVFGEISLQASDELKLFVGMDYTTKVQNQAKLEDLFLRAGCVFTL